FGAGVAFWEAGGVALILGVGTAFEMDLLFADESAFFEEAIDAPFTETGFVADLAPLTEVVFNPEEAFCLALDEIGLVLRGVGLTLAGADLALTGAGFALAEAALALVGAGFALAGAALALAGAGFALVGAALAIAGAALALTGAGFAPVEACFSATFLMGAGLPSDFAGLDLGIKLGSKVSRLCWRNSGGGKK
ncbi:MAG: hypothetical protein WCK17_18020, partial [Verrucomicrobiota bacterium]